MDPRKLFADERFTEQCVYCGRKPSTRDHVPSRVLLDEPFPSDLPVVPACQTCNNGFSIDEQYLACFVECAITGSVNPTSIRRDKVRRILNENPALASQILKNRRVDNSGNVLWMPEEERIQNVVLKLARGHAAYEFSEPQLAEQDYLTYIPITKISDEQLRSFETPPMESVFPELGSRAFLHLTVTGSQVLSVEGSWQVIQEGRYRYLVSYSDRITVRMVLSEYLLCEVIW